MPAPMAKSARLHRQRHGDIGDIQQRPRQHRTEETHQARAAVAQRRGIEDHVIWARAWAAAPCAPAHRRQNMSPARRKSAESAVALRRQPPPAAPVSPMATVAVYRLACTSHWRLTRSATSPEKWRQDQQRHAVAECHQPDLESRARQIQHVPAQRHRLQQKSDMHQHIARPVPTVYAHAEAAAVDKGEDHLTTLSPPIAIGGGKIPHFSKPLCISKRRIVGATRWAARHRNTLPPDSTGGPRRVALPPDSTGGPRGGGVSSAKRNFLHQVAQDRQRRIFRHDGPGRAAIDHDAIPRRRDRFQHRPTEGMPHIT